jgi:hypothetical protein
MLRRAWILAATALAACSPVTSFEGTVHGITLDVQSSAFTMDRNGSGVIEFLVLYLSDQPDVCSLIQGGANARSSTTLSVWLYQTDLNSNNVTPTPGNFSVRNGSVPGQAIPSLRQLDADCLSAVDAAAASGFATVDAYQAEPGGSMIGSFDFAFEPSGEKGKGTFNAPFCDGPWLLSGCR